MEPKLVGGRTTTRSRTAARSSEPTDRALLGKIAGGDEASFSALVERYQGRFFRVARRMLRDDGDAEDAVQTAFLNVFRGAGGYRENWSGSTWLYRVLTNACIDACRKRRPVDFVEELAAKDGAGSTVERLDVERALAEVPPEARAVLVLCYVEELSYAEIAEARGIAVNTVKTQLLRAKRRMRLELEEARS